MVKKPNILLLISISLLTMFFIHIDSLGQIPVINTPQPATMQPNVTIGSQSSMQNGSIPNLPNYNTSRSIEQTNMDIIRRDLEQLNTASNPLGTSLDIPDQQDYRQQLMNYVRANYRNAFNNLKNMLEGNAPLELKKAVFEVEHAFNNTFTYEEYDQKVQELVNVVKYLNGGNNNNAFINLAICKAMADTVSIPVPGKEDTLVSYPLTYDFNDYYGDKDYNNLFVSKLLFTHSGQCHSLPLLFMILAQETGAQAYLSFSPNHSFIRFKDKNGRLYNYETTQGKIVSNEWVMGSGYITSNAIKSGIFLDTVNTRQVVAYCLNDLAMGYIKIFGMEDTTFIQHCTDLSLQYYPDKNATAYILKNNLYLSRLVTLMKQKGIKGETAIENDPGTKTLWNKHNYYHNLLQDKGYKAIPRELYDKWLESARGSGLVNDKEPKSKNPVKTKN